MRGEGEEARPTPKGKREIDAAAKKLGKFLRVKLSRLRGSERSWEVSKARTQAAYVLVRRLGYRLSDVAAYFGRDAATVASLLARLGAKVQTEAKEKDAIERMVKIVNS
jgi:chromosomal replication initiation ATPase DnaA